MGIFDIEAGEAVKFERVGDKVTGTITRPYTTRESTEFGSDKTKLDKNGRPVMMAVIELQTNLRDDADDDGIRVLYADKFGMRKAIGAALRDAHAKDLEEGGVLTVQLVREEDSGKGNPMKVFAAAYTPPTAGAATWGLEEPVLSTPTTTAPPAQPTLPINEPPARPAAPATNGGDLVARIREFAGYGMPPEKIAELVPGVSREAIAAVLAIPA